MKEFSFWKGAFPQSPWLDYLAVETMESQGDLEEKVPLASRSLGVLPICSPVVR